MDNLLFSEYDGSQIIHVNRYVDRATEIKTADGRWFEWVDESFRQEPGVPFQPAGHWELIK